MAIQSVNPTTGKILRTFDALKSVEIEKKLEIAQEAHLSWRKLSIKQRGEHMKKIAQNMRDNAEEYAALLTTEMGKTIGEARAEVEKCALNFDHFAEKSVGYLEPRSVDTDATESYVTYEPLGVILTIMPWNFAFWQALRMAAPILMAGNTIVLKHASNVPQSAMKIEELMLRAGLPKGVYQTLLIGSSQVEKIIEHDLVKGVSLTGSEYAGTQVGAQAGKAIKPIVLELGGSDPSIVLDDADVPFACEVATRSRLQNNGQSCIGSKRFIVQEAVYDEFLEKLKAIFESYVIGDPMNDKTMIGPIVSKQAFDELVDQIGRSVKAGAKIAYGGKKVGEKGYFLQPTILTDVTPGVPSYSEEMFGPIVSIIRVKGDSEAIRVANDTRFGLGASLYTTNMDRAKQLIPKIESGSVFVNGMVKSDPRLPFGGIKKSGVGRELSEEGIRAFTNIKTVWIK